MNAVNFLINTLFDIYIMVVLLRVWLQLARADFYNPFSQFIVKATQPVVAPLRRIIPSMGGIDTATIVFAYLVACGTFVALSLIQGGAIDPVSTLIYSAVIVILATFKMLFWVLILRAILSWVSQGHNPIEAVMHQLTEPLLAPVRRFIPPMGGLDLSMIVVIIALNFVEILVRDILGKII